MIFTRARVPRQLPDFTFGEAFRSRFNLYLFGALPLNFNWPRPGRCTKSAHCCRYSKDTAADAFGCTAIEDAITRDRIPNVDNPKVVIEEMDLGKGLLAVVPIRKDEVISTFDGEIYRAKRTSDLSKDIADHAIQIGPNAWRDSRGIARYVNHSCEPNLGYRGVDTLVAMRDIAAGEKLTVDYEMTERSDWRMQCHCGMPSCRKVIGTFDNLPDDIRRRYNGYISNWLIQEWRAAA